MRFIILSVSKFDQKLKERWSVEPHSGINYADSAGL